MPSIVGARTRRLQLPAPQETIYDKVGTTYGRHLDGRAGYYSQYPASESYQRSLDEWYSDRLRERAEARGWQRGKRAPQQGPEAPSPGPRKSRRGDTGYRGGFGPYTRSQGSSSSVGPGFADPPRGYRAFDIPTDNLPVPYSALGKWLRLLPKAARLNPYFRGLSLAYDVYSALGGPLPGDFFFPGNATNCRGSSPISCPNHTDPWLKNWLWFERKYCPDACAPWEINHNLAKYSLGVQCWSNQFWDCYWASTPGSYINKCRIIQHCTGYACYGDGYRIYQVAGWDARNCNSPPAPGVKWYINPYWHFTWNFANQYEPMMNPIGKPTSAAPLPAMYKDVPRLATGPQIRERGPRTRRRPEVVSHGPTVRRSLQTEITLTSGGAAPPRVRSRVREGFHERRPPNRWEREKKFRTQGPIGRALGVLLGGVTEGLDAVDSIYDALPDYYRIECREPERRGPYGTQGRPRRAYTDERIAAVLLFLQNGTEREYAVVWPEALANMLWNDVEDRGIGTASQERGEAFEAFGRDAGLPDPGRWASRRVAMRSGEVVC